MSLSFKKIIFAIICLSYILLMPAHAGAVASRRISPGQWQQLTADKAFSYKDDSEVVHPPKPIQPNLLQKLLRELFSFFGGRAGNILLWLIVIGAVSWLLYQFFISKDSFLFGRNRNVMSDTGPPGDEEDIATTNWEALLADAAGKSDVRLAVRYSYMWLLQLLQQHELIKYRSDKTNYEYYTELGETNYKQSFRQLSRQYEYAWYGHFNLPPAAYKDYMELFDNFKKQLGS